MKLNILIVLSIFLLVACEKIDITGNEEDTQENGKVNVTFKIDNIEKIPFENTTSRASMSSLCSHFTVATFQDGTKVNSTNQTAEDTSFGTVSMSLQPGTYQLVAIAHNGSGNCTVSTPEKITFANNKMTDTFYYYGSLTVSEESTQSLSLKRAVSMYRLNITDNMPETVAQMQFYYTGGSSTFDAVTGFGCVNSRQTEIFSVSESDYGKPSTFEVYSFPHDLNDELNITVTALDASGTTVAEKSYSKVPIQQNVITQHSESFFSGVSGSNTTTSSFSIENDGQWDNTINQ